jgi:hypothetical protein
MRVKEKRRQQRNKTFELRVRETVIKLVTVEAYDEAGARAAYNDGDVGVVMILQIDLVDFSVESVKEVE